MKNSEGNSRRSFIFGVGAFATGIFLPSKKLYFPVAENPTVYDPGGFSMPFVEPNPAYWLWMITEEIPTKAGRKGYSEIARYSAYWRQKMGSPPRNPMDGERVKDKFMKSVERIADPEISRVRFESLDCAYYKV